MGVGSALSVVWCDWVWCLCQEYVSAFPDYCSVGNVDTLILTVCKRHSASFRISLEGNCSVSNCTFSVGGSEFRSLLCYHLGPELPVHVLFKKDTVVKYALVA